MKNIFPSIIFLFILVSCQGTTSSSSLSSETISSSTSSSDVISYDQTSMVKLTTGDKEHLLETQENIKATSIPTSGSTVVHVNEENTLAPVKMFGAALTHASAHQLMLDEEGDQRKAILKDLFTSQGANFNAIRVPIGASDFHAEEHVFTNCDVKGGEDDLLANFNLDHDQELIQVIKEIYEIKPELKIIAVPWSAPEWMKVDSNASTEDPNGPKLCGGTLNNLYLKTYAQYLEKFCYAYSDLGIEINYLSLENEPTYNGADYPCMKLSASQAKTIALELNSTLPEWTSLMAYDHNCEDTLYTYLGEEFDTSTTRDIFSSIAIHGYGSQPIPEGTRALRELYPEKEIYMTEITEWEHGSSFATDLMYVCQNTTIKAYQNGLSGTLYWNLALDSNGGPNIGQKSTCYGVVNIDQADDGSLIYTKRPSYYGLSALSSLLEIEDAVVTYSLETEYENDSLLVAAFIKDNKYTVISANTSYSEQSVSVEIEDQYYSFDIPAQSILGFTFS